ncbi:ShlB/FhaC/HecB family hemolysin secretion/activation protein [Cupriavidus pauculus]|uniref:ShlB/FhaC/HecB family hemolysin secretion/activation protein n=3 Tax=Pseudomonadota TaxID=1224 RepID=A0A3G8H5L3_9BURK|nr:ShlB/FhaC/HecB family hemolysin secretion/activation protein [Cupriavidus pauculus]
MEMSRQHGIGERSRLSRAAMLLIMVAHAGAAAAQAAPARFDVNEYVVRGNTVLDAVEIETSIEPFLGPDRSVDDVQAARAALEKRYQDRGYQSVVVELPEQRVTGGVVVLQVVETRVGRLRVVGAEHYSPAMVRDAVPSLAEGGVPDFNAAQQQLTSLNTTPNRQVVPMVRPGSLPQTVDVELKVEDHNPLGGSVSLNNDHSVDTHALRASATLSHDNLWQRGHQASVTFFGAPQALSEARVWSFSYLAPFRNSPFSVQATGYTSDSNVATVGGTSVLGNGYAVGLQGNYALPQTGDWTGSVGLGFDFKDLKEKVSLGGSSSDVPIHYVPMTLSFNGYRFSERSQSALALSAVMGTGIGSGAQDFGAKRYRASPDFMYLKADGSHTQTLGSGAQLYARGAAQVSSGPLVSSEQFAAGGATSVRGYYSAEATSDNGVLGSLEVRSPSYADWLWAGVDEWRVYGFLDAATLRLKDPLPEQRRSYTLLGVGFGTSFRMYRAVTGKLDFGWPLRDAQRTEAGSLTVNFNVRANF